MAPVRAKQAAGSGGDGGLRGDQAQLLELGVIEQSPPVLCRWYILAFELWAPVVGTIVGVATEERRHNNCSGLHGSADLLACVASRGGGGGGGGGEI